MSGAGVERSPLDVMSDILVLTRKMAASGDADFLISSIDKRGSLIEEYNRVKDSGSGEQDKAEIKKMIAEISALNKKIDVTVRVMRDEARREVEGTLTNKKVLNYANNAISSSGSYMDYRK